MSAGSPAERKIRDAILDELRRQADAGGGLSVEITGDDVAVNGTVRLGDLAEAVLASVAGGP